MSDKIIYETHPVTEDRKKELRESGYKIIDAEFSPDGYEAKESKKPESKKAK